MSEMQRRQWRNTAMLGLLFSIATIHSFMATPFYLNMTSDYLNAPFVGGSFRLFDDPQPSAYPYLIGMIVLISLPFFLAALHVIARIQVFFGADGSVLRTVIQTTAVSAFLMAALLTIAHLYAELHTQDTRTFDEYIKLNLVFAYFYVMFAGTTIIGFGIGVMEFGFRQLGWMSISLGGLSILLNFFVVPNYDLPSFRVALGVMPMSIDIVIWSSFMWLASRSVRVEDQPTTVTR